MFTLPAGKRKKIYNVTKPVRKEVPPSVKKSPRKEDPLLQKAENLKSEYLNKCNPSLIII